MPCPDSALYPWVWVFHSLTILGLWELWQLLQCSGWLTWKHQTPSRNQKHVFHQVVMISQHTRPPRSLGVSVSRSSRCVRPGIVLLQGTLLISPVGSPSDRSAPNTVGSDQRWQHHRLVSPTERSATLTSCALWPLTSCLQHWLFFGPSVPN